MVGYTNMKNYNKLRLILFLSVLPVLACYTHNTYAAEVTVYKCRVSQSQSVIFQDTPCVNNEHMQVKNYAINEAGADGLRPSEVAALEQMHTRQNLERVEQIRIREQQREERAREARDNSRKNDGSYIIINNNNAAYNPSIQRRYIKQQPALQKQGRGFSIKLQYKN